MKNKINNEELIMQLKSEMKNCKNKRMYIRYSVILKHFQGLTNKDIAKLENLEEHTVGRYIKNYNAKGIEGLVMNTSPGAPRKLSPKQEEKLIDIITNNTPDEVGFDSRKNWTIQLAREWVYNNFKIDIKHSSMCVILHRLNLSYTRPTYVLKKADKKKQEEYINDFENLKKTP